MSAAPERPASVDERLEYLADHLDYPMAERLLQLLDASSSIHELVELRHRVRRAEDLVTELRRHLAVRERQLRDALSEPVLP